MTLVELAEKARRVYPEYEIYRAVRYKNTVTFYFENPNGNSQIERMVVNGDISYTMDGKVTFVDLNDPKIWKDLVEIPTAEWQKSSLEHYGRKGMHWYEHIFGDEDKRGKYNTHGTSNSVGMGMRLDSSPRRPIDGMLCGKPVADFKYRDLNPRFGQVMPDGTDYSHNCLNCGVVYDLNRRGYRVSAAPSKPGGVGRVTRCYKGGDKAMQCLDDDHLGDLGSPQANQQRNMEAMRQAIFGHPAGSRGVIICSGYGRNHCMAWERRDEDGFTIIDAQTGQNVTGDQWKYWKGAGCFGVMRTDNLEINDDTIDDVIDPAFVPPPIPRSSSILDDDDNAIHYDQSSDISFDSLSDEGKQEFLEHYGRIGMKWYQHKYGEEDSRAQYNANANRGAAKKNTNLVKASSRKNATPYFTSDKAILDKGLMISMGGGSAPIDAKEDALTEEKLEDWFKYIEQDDYYKDLVDVMGGIPYETIHGKTKVIPLDQAKELLKEMKEKRQYQEARERQKEAQEKAAYYTPQNRDALMRDKALDDLNKARKTFSTDTKTTTYTDIVNGKVEGKKTVTEKDLSSLRKAVDDGKVTDSAMEKAADFVGSILSVHSNENIESRTTISDIDKKR